VVYDPDAVPQILSEPQRFGSYLLVEHLGRGGMADMFLARTMVRDLSAERDLSAADRGSPAQVLKTHLYGRGHVARGRYAEFSRLS
jgi:hypothetical protein